jgi:hypothetical protein
MFGLFLKEILVVIPEVRLPICKAPIPMLRRRRRRKKKRRTGARRSLIGNKTHWRATPKELWTRLGPS